MQNLVKTWEMELSHKTCVNDFKTIHHDKFRFSVNGEINFDYKFTILMIRIMSTMRAQHNITKIMLLYSTALILH